jgi:LuxR family maltose regulon positive regulatory protein
MAVPVLATKFFVPPLRSDLVFRRRLIDQFDIAVQRKLILISAPAGYGKTTLVSSWLSETKMPAAWLSLDEDDNDPVRFFQNFTTALQRILPAIGEGLMVMPEGAQSAAFDPSINLLINEVMGHPNPFAVILDDFHVIHSQAVLDMVTLYLERMPPQMKLVIITRTDPPIPLARLRARNQLEDIRADQLRFRLDEITVFLNEIMRLKLSASDLAAMEAKTEGWIASLQLAALSMQGSQDAHTFVKAFAGSHHYVMDYLIEEVLNMQSEKIRLFLLQTSILERMCASLCHAVVNLGESEEVNEQEMLETLEQMNLFVIPLDNERQWYRYHHLFADVLNRRLEHLFPQHLPELQRRASQWYEQNGFVPEAIQHALRAADHERAIQLIERNGCLLLVRGEVSTLHKWIEAVEPRIQTRPWMYIFKAWLFALTGHPEQVEEMLQVAEKLISSLEPAVHVRTMQGAIATARAYQANLQGATSLAARFSQQALEYLPDIGLISRSLRTVATSLLGDASSINGDLGEARQAYSEAMRIAQVAGDVHLTIVLNSNIANILMEQGSLHEAARIYSETLEMATRPDGQKLVMAGRLFAELSEVSYEWNHLETSMQQVQQSIALCRQWGNIDRQAIGCVMLAQLEHVQHHDEKGQEAARLAERLLNEHHLLPKHSVWVKYVLARLWIAQGDLKKASNLVQQCNIKIDDDEIPYLRELEYLALIRVLLATKDYGPALTLSQRILQKAEAGNRMRRVIEILVLQALLFQGRREIEEALKVLGRALSLARPEGYVRTFADEGEPMSKLLHLAKARRIEMEYASELLSALGDTVERKQTPVLALVEPLSPREVEVLKLIEAGCSNQEIAARLVISIATVKRHISNIYIKLGAQNRTQAVSIGRELGLFS